MRKLIILLLFLVAVYFLIQGSSRYLPSLGVNQNNPQTSSGTVKVVSEESVIINVIKKISRSVVTIGVESPPQSNNTSPDFQQGPFSLFFGQPPQNQSPTPD